MTTWEQAKAAIRTACASATGMHPMSVVWRTGGEPVGVRLLQLDIVSQINEGPVRVVATADAAGLNDLEINEPVQFTVCVRAEDAMQDPQALAQEVRSGLQLPSIREALKAAGVTPVAEPLAIRPMHYVRDGADVAACVFDCIFRAVFVRKDPQKQAVFETIEAEGQLADGPVPPAEPILVEITATAP